MFPYAKSAAILVTGNPYDVLNDRAQILIDLLLDAVQAAMRR